MSGHKGERDATKVPGRTQTEDVGFMGVPLLGVFNLSSPVKLNGIASLIVPLHH